MSANKKSSSFTFSKAIKYIDLFGYPVNLSFDAKGGGGTNSIFFPQPTH